MQQDPWLSPSLSQRWRLIRSYYYFPTTGYPRGDPINGRPPPGVVRAPVAANPWGVVITNVHAHLH